ncbi:helix-turn-helix domain-containing protein [Streptomyces sp. NPDC088910]|uniref:helix-turn-helix domain-containing protein n=1 Tax=Streptomyces sp. NPDC088910 TaxID=3365911 RepID=UPI00382BF9C8
MPDIFDQIEWSVRKIFGEGPVCVHVGNVDECEIKRHPTYPKFRAEAVRAGVRSAPSSRLWESMIARGRLCDMDGDYTWRLVILDCIVPCFRTLSASISRDFRVEREEVRSAMTATALEVWADTVMGVPPRHVRDRMVKAAFDVAFRRGRAAVSEHSTDDIDLFFQPEVSAQGSVLRALSIINVDDIRDADVAEKIRGERFGALLQTWDCFDAVRGFHDELRSGRRTGSISQVVKQRLTRSWISNPNLYYYASDFYPSYIGLQEAAGVMGITESAARRLIKEGELPFPVARVGRSYKVSVKALMHFMRMPDAIVHVDDVENGAFHAGGGAGRPRGLG